MFELENIIEDLHTVEKGVLMNLHWDLDQYDEAEFDRMNTVFGAKDKKDRVVDPLSLIGKG